MLPVTLGKIDEEYTQDPWTRPDLPRRTVSPARRPFASSLLTVGIIVFLLVAWVGRVIVMLLLAAVVFAVLLSAVVDWVTTKLKIRRGLAFALLLAAGFVVVFLTLWIRGPSIIEQFADLQTDLPQAAHKFLERLNGYQWGRWLTRSMV